MFKLILSQLTVFVFLANMAFSQNYFDKTYSIGFNDTPTAFISDAENNLIVCGWTEAEGDETVPRAFALKVDASGNELWRIVLDETSKFYALCETSEGNIALAGSKDDYCFLRMVNGTTGEKIWEYQGDDSEGFWFGSVNELQINEDGNIVRKLHLSKTTSGQHHFLYYLMSPETGEVLEQNENPNYNYDPVYTSTLIKPDMVWVAAVTPGGAGVVVNDNFGEGGGFLWTFSAKRIAGVERFSADQACVVRSFTHEIAILTYNLTYADVYGNDFPVDHEGFTVGGSGMLGNYDKVLVTGSVDGELALWGINNSLENMEEVLLPSALPRTGVDVIGYQDDNLVVMGIENGTEKGAADIFLRKMNYYQIISVDEISGDEEIVLYPNPVTDHFYIRNPGKKELRYVITDLSGRTVKEGRYLNGTVETSRLPEGVFTVRVFSDSKLLKQAKFVKVQ